MKNFALHLPINSVSFGQVSIALLREFFNKKYNPLLFSIGNPDVSSQKISQELGNWMNNSLNKAFTSYSRDIPIFKLWHIEGSLESLAKEQTLLTFYELDQPTDIELNIIKNNKTVIVTNNYTYNVLSDYGCNNLKVIPLGFDKYNFNVKDKKYFDDRIVFNILGKFEKRKNHAKAIKAWIKKYGNNPEYYLQCAIYNPFHSPEENEAIIRDLVDNKKYFNVQFLGYMQQNELFNDFLNSAHIVLAMSGAEGWGLGEFHSVALGKYCVGLYAHGHKEWMNPDNSVLVKPSSKQESYDGKFFIKGRHVNQGNIFDFNEEEFINGCEKAINLYKSNKVNKKGLELQNVFTYEKTVDQIIETI